MNLFFPSVIFYSKNTSPSHLENKITIVDEKNTIENYDLLVSEFKENYKQLLYREKLILGYHLKDESKLFPETIQFDSDEYRFTHKYHISDIYVSSMDIKELTYLEVRKLLIDFSIKQIKKELSSEQKKKQMDELISGGTLEF